MVSDEIRDKCFSVRDNKNLSRDEKLIELAYITIELIKLGDFQPLPKPQKNSAIEEYLLLSAEDKKKLGVKKPEYFKENPSIPEYLEKIRKNWYINIGNADYLEQYCLKYIPKEDIPNIRILETRINDLRKAIHILDLALPFFVEARKETPIINNDNVNHIKDLFNGEVIYGQ